MTSWLYPVERPSKPPRGSSISDLSNHGSLHIPRKRDKRQRNVDVTLEARVSDPVMTSWLYPVERPSKPPRGSSVSDLSNHGSLHIPRKRDKRGSHSLPRPRPYQLSDGTRATAHRSGRPRHLRCDGRMARSHELIFLFTNSTFKRFLTPSQLESPPIALTAGLNSMVRSLKRNPKLEHWKGGKVKKRDWGLVMEKGGGGGGAKKGNREGGGRGEGGGVGEGRGGGAAAAPPPQISNRLWFLPFSFLSAPFAHYLSKENLLSQKKITLLSFSLFLPCSLISMDSSNGNQLEIFSVGPCQEQFQLGFLIGERFSHLIRSRVQKDLILQNQLIPFASTPKGKSLLESLEASSRKKYPKYWDELVGTARGSGVPLLSIILMNLRKEILPFIDRKEDSVDDDCSDLLIVNDSLAIAAHNEDANVALLNHTYLLKVVLANGISFTAYTYAGELPSCAFGFNNYGLAFTLNSVPPLNKEMMAGGIALNFISRDLLEAIDINDAMDRICEVNVSAGHSYNLIDVKSRRIINIETASRNRFSIREIGKEPFFHANMYLHLNVNQVQDENSMSRQKSAAILEANSKENILSLLGDYSHEKYPIFMTGPVLYTLCTVLVDLDDEILTIYKGNPKNKDVIHKFRIE
ncbi:hypothetical protein LUZ60_010072 [Juncus effusus]|nr:hypothetical protein LUZ60_010072 [Juncus effusus]